MAAALLMWTRYVVAYLETDNTFGRALSIAGRVFFALGLAAVAANLLTPVMFWFDEAGGYHAGVARYATLGVQVLMFLLTSMYTLYVTSKSEGTVRRRQVHPHHRVHRQRLRRGRAAQPASGPERPSEQAGGAPGAV